MTDEAINTGGDPKDTWKYRRRTVVFCVAFLSGIILYVLLWGDPASEIHKMAMEGAFWALVGIVATYIGGAVADYGLQAWAGRVKP